MGDQGGLPGIDNPSDEVISQVAFAKLVGVSGPSITKAIKTGRLPADCVVQTRTGKQLYKNLALAQWEYLHSRPTDLDASKQTEPAQQLSREAKQDVSDLDSVAWPKLLVKRQALIAGEKAQIAYMERCEIEGSMHHADDVRAVWEARIEAAKSALLGIPGEVSGELGIKLKRDQITVNEVLTGVIERICAELANDLKPDIREHRKKRVSKRG